MSDALLSWGRYPQLPQTPRYVHWRGDLTPSLLPAMLESGGSLPYGNGRSYGDSCLAASGHVIATRGLDRFLHADWATGRIIVEPGMTLGELLAVTVPRGWFLCVTPGTQFVTVGGAIANDVHGKNHHRQGTFGCHVIRLGLVRSQEGVLSCSPAEEPALFSATLGGLGLTGIIAWAELQLAPITSASIDLTAQRFESLDEFFTLSAELDPAHEFSVAWVDCAARGRASGRGIYMAGDYSSEGNLAVSTPARLSIPFTPPISLVNRLSLRCFNELYWRRAPRKRTYSRSSYASFFYPLDGIRGWNRLYGPRGFQQYQCVLPPEDARDGIAMLLQAIAQAGTGSFLAVLKRFGDRPSPGLLSFPRPGVTLALDFPNGRDLSEPLFKRLDSIVREADGRIYPAKDARVSAADFQRAYPRWTELESLRDPALNSRFWQRVSQ